MEPIATRILKCRDKETEIEIPIRIFAPEDKRDHWICRFEIGWPDEALKRYGAGQDSMQALVIALQMIAAILYTSEAHKSGSLVWGERGSGYGFPVVSSLRDLLKGDDAKYF